MTALPSGMVAFLLTDIEGSSRLWETHPEAMARALAEHDRLLRQAIASQHGHLFATAGDSMAAAFHNVADAVNAAMAAQLAMAGLSAGGEPVRVRMALHTGEAEERDGDYFGQVLNRCGRLRDAANGGQVVVSRAVHELLNEAGLRGGSMIDLGEHRLRDLEHPEQIFQLAHSDLESDFPPLRTLTKATTNFPVQLTSFVGREQELEEVAKLVRGSRLVTMTGVGGSGKTRLALQAAAALASEFKDGVWLIDLAPVSEPELVVEQVAAVFGVREQANRSLMESLVDHHRTRQTLLVLDNCEHLIDTACRVAVALLGGTQNLRIMATSRESLHLPGEVAYLVPPLGIPGPGERVDRQMVGRFDAVRLFAARAESARPGFRLTSDTADTILEICRRLDGIPLAIELAAARLGSFTAKQIASHLDRRFRLLSGGRRTVLPRQETLQATIDWSYALLDDLERLLFQRLSVFRGDFSLEAAQRIVGGEALDEMDLLEVLPRLVDKSMIMAKPADGEMRYHLLETLREYASELWQVTGEGPATEARHAAVFLDLAEEGAASLGRTAKHDEWMNRLRAERDNLRQALRWTLDSGQIETGLRLGGTLYRFWLFNDAPSEGTWWLETLLSNDITVPDSVKAKALLGLGSLSSQLLGKSKTGISALRRAVETYRRISDTNGIDYGSALNNLAGILVPTGAYAEAEAYYEEALGVSRALDVQWGVAITLGNLARVAALTGRVEQARERFEQSIHEARELGSHRLLGDTLVSRANFELDYGTPEAAIDCYEESIQAFLEAGRLPGAHLARADMAIAWLRLGQLDRAVDLFLPNAEALLEDPEMVSQGSVLVDLLLGRAEIAIASNDPDGAGTMLGFVDGLVEAGEFADSLVRHQHLKAEIAKSMDPDQLGAVLARGRAMDLGQVSQLIARN